MMGPLASQEAGVATGSPNAEPSSLSGVHRALETRSRLGTAREARERVFTFLSARPALGTPGAGGTPARLGHILKPTRHKPNRTWRGKRQWTCRQTRAHVQKHKHSWPPAGAATLRHRSWGHLESKGQAGLAPCSASRRDHFRESLWSPKPWPPCARSVNAEGEQLNGTFSN